MSDSENGVIAEARGLIEEYIRPEVGPVTTPDGVTALVSVSRTGVKILDPAEFDAWRTGPRRLQGTATLTRLESLIEHVNRFKDDDSVIYASEDRSNPKLTAVLNYHERRNTPFAEVGEEISTEFPRPRWGDHRAVFNFPISDEWKAWTGSNIKWFSMPDFAKFIEDRIIDVSDDHANLPADLADLVKRTNGKIASSARLMELSVNLEVFEGSKAGQKVNLQTGEATFEMTSEHQDRAGNKLSIPGMFVIRIPVFKHDVAYRLGARLRYRKTGDGLVFSYELFRHDAAFDDAVKNAAETVAERTELPLFFGSPE